MKATAAFTQTAQQARSLPHPEQTAIAEVLTDMDAELAALEQRRERPRLKQAMMQELLTGRTRRMSWTSSRALAHRWSWLRRYGSRLAVEPN